MNYSIVKLIITLVTFFSIAFVDSHSIDKRSMSSNEGVIIGPDTPVYYVGYSRDGNFTYNGLFDKFEGSPSYYYYRDSEYKSNDTFFMKILVIYDWDNRAEISEHDILNEVLTKWNKVDKYFEQLDNPKIKLAIAGVIIPTKSDLLGATIANGTSSRQKNSKFVYSYSSLSNIMKWLNNNADHFENLNYDYFIFMSRWNVALPKSESGGFLPFIDTSFSCDAKHGSHHHSVGEIVRNSDRFSLNAAFSLGSLFDLDSDQRARCEGGHIMDLRNLNMNVTWSECSKRQFKLLINNSRYACLHEIPYGQYEDDYTIFRKDF